MDYRISKYFEDNNLFGDKLSDGLIITNNNQLVISGDSRDLVELADILVSLALNKDESHIHIDDLTLLDKKSDIKELIIEKNSHF